MKLGYKFQIKPNKQQQASIHKMFGCSRFVYNHYLEQASKNKWNLKQASKDLTDLISTTPWLREVPSTALRQSQRNLDQAYRRFFKKQNQYPSFKSKHNAQSARLQDCKVEQTRIFLSKIGWIKLNRTRECGSASMITISYENKRYYASWVADTNTTYLGQTGICGIDLGLSSLMTICSDKISHIPHPRILKKKEARLKHYQRILSRKTKGSNRRTKARHMLSKYHKHIAASRNDHHHKLTKQIIHENQVVFVEEHNMQFMLANHKLAKSTADASLYKLKQMLKYKSELYGSAYHEVSALLACSKTCSSCGYVHDLKLNDREWICPSCLVFHDRDANASRNILRHGMKIYYPQAVGLSSWRDKPLDHIDPSLLNEARTCRRLDNSSETTEVGTLK